MHVLEAISAADVNGAVVHCRLVSKELLSRGHRVTLLARPGAWIARELAGTGVSVRESDLHRVPTDELRRVAELCRTERVDVVHTHMSRASFFGVLLSRAAGIPSVATAHARHVQLHWAFNERVIAVSDATARFHRRFNRVRPSRLDVIPNFVETESPPPGAREAVRDALGVPADVLLVGAVGELARAKGQDVLLEAFARAPRGEPWLLLVGEGPDRARLEALARHLGVSSRVVFAGYRADVPRVLTALDVFASASREENLAMSVLQAMAAGLPVIATRVGGLPECIAEEETGLLVKPRSVSELAAALAELAADPTRRARLGSAGRARAVRLFSADAQASRIEASLARAVDDYASSRSERQEART